MKPLRNKLESVFVDTEATGELNNLVWRITRISLWGYFGAPIDDFVCTPINHQLVDTLSTIWYNKDTSKE